MKKVLSLLLVGIIAVQCNLNAVRISRDTYLLNNKQITTFLKKHGHDINTVARTAKSVRDFKDDLENSSDDIENINLEDVNGLVDCVRKLGFVSSEKKQLDDDEILFIHGLKESGYFAQDKNRFLSWEHIGSRFGRLSDKNSKIFNAFSRMIKENIKREKKAVTATVSISKENTVDVNVLCSKIIQVIAPQGSSLYALRNLDSPKRLMPTFHVLFKLSKGEIVLTGFPQIPQAFFKGIEDIVESSTIGKVLKVGLAGVLLLGGGDALLNKSNGVKGAYRGVKKAAGSVGSVWQQPSHTDLNQQLLSLKQGNEALKKEVKGLQLTLENNFASMAAVVKDILKQNNKLSHHNFSKALVEMKNLMNHGGQSLIDACNGDKAKNDAICKLVNLAVGKAQGDLKAQLNVLKIEKESLDQKIKEQVSNLKETANKVGAGLQKDDKFAEVLEKIERKANEIQEKLKKEQEGNKNKESSLNEEITNLKKEIEKNKKRSDLMNRFGKLMEEWNKQ